MLHDVPICEFCEANAGHNQQLRLLKVKRGTIRQGCSPLLFSKIGKFVGILDQGQKLWSKYKILIFAEK